MMIRPTCIALLALTACAGVGSDFDAHRYNIGAQPGTVETITIRIEWDHVLTVREKCGIDAALGCATFATRTPIENSSPVLAKLPEGVDCVIYSPPNLNILTHEMKHCLTRENWDSGVVR